MNLQAILNGIKLPQVRIKKEYFNLLLWLLFFLVSARLVRLLDITAAPVDPGILTVILVAILAVLAFQAVTWAILKLIWPMFANYSEYHFEQNFKSLLPWQKVLIYLGYYLFLLYAFVICFSALY